MRTRMIVLAAAACLPSLVAGQASAQTDSSVEDRLRRLEQRQEQTEQELKQ